MLAERETLSRWFGPMLEASFGRLFEQTILPAMAEFAEVGMARRACAFNATMAPRRWWGAAAGLSRDSAPGAA